MSTDPVSRPSLADLIPLVEAADLTSVQKRDMVSAVKAVGRVLGAELAEIPAQPGALRRRLEGISPEALGLSTGRWANVRSLLNKALALAAPVMPSRQVQPLLASWEKLSSGLTFNRRVQLLPLLRFLSARGTGPEAVTHSDLEAYRRAIFENRLRKHPEKAWDALVWSWNASGREVVGWTQVALERADRRETYILPWDHFPPSFKVDADAYLVRLGSVSLDEEGPAKPARPETLKTRGYQIRVAAAALVHRGIPPEAIRGLADLVTLENYQSLLSFFLDRHQNKTSPQVAQLASFLKDVGRHWVKLDDEALGKLKRIASKLAMPRQGLTAKNRQRLRPLDDPAVVSAFLSLPDRIRSDVERERQKTGRITRSMAVRAQVGAAIALLQSAPIRRKNLVSLDIETHLLARGDRVYLVIGADEVKNAEPIDFELPRETVAVLAWYIRDYRPVLLATPGPSLFPGEKEGPKNANTLGVQISETVERYLGIAFNTHLFRHAAGKIFLDARPGQYEVMRRVLSHKSIETTTAIYAGAETKSAGAHFASVIAERRRALENEVAQKQPRRKKAGADGPRAETKPRRKERP
jgi:integrase